MPFHSQTSPEWKLLVKDFCVQSSAYYIKEFGRLQNGRFLLPSINWLAGFLGPLWAAARGLWGCFWVFAFAEAIALVLIGRGLWADLGASARTRADQIIAAATAMEERAAAALANGESAAEGLLKSAANLRLAAKEALTAAEVTSASSLQLLAIGAVALLLIKLCQAMVANFVYERRFRRWQSDRTIDGSFSWLRLLAGIIGVAVIYVLSVVSYVAPGSMSDIVALPASNSLHTTIAGSLDNILDTVAQKGSGVFEGVTAVIRFMVGLWETVLLGMPWFAILLAIFVISWQLSGIRVAIFVAAALGYLAFMGFWEKSMMTIALLGTASAICIVIGIPLGIFCAKNDRFQRVVHPMLDFMQTMPAFVYLIPVIALFGTGTSAAVLATVIFGMPPIIRLTTLGIQQVPYNVKEAALAFGCTNWKLLKEVEVPLALPSIMTGVNQTVLLCLSMVVIASLIGAKGLGEDVLSALQYAAKGQGILAGFAILFCAMIIDRVIQGKWSKRLTHISGPR